MHAINSDHYRKIALASKKDRKSFSDNGTGFFSGAPGAITAFIHNGAALRYLAYVEFQPGISRGDHLHARREQTLIVLSGQIVGQYYLPDQPDHVVLLDLVAGEGVWLAAGVAHSHRAIVPSAAIEYSGSRYEDDDTIEMPFTWT